MLFSEITSTLISDYIITNDLQYIDKLSLHLLARFVDPDKRMNLKLLYGQLIKGRKNYACSASVNLAKDTISVII